MEKHLLMDITNGGLLYQMFYLLAFLIIYLILIYEGYQEEISTSSLGTPSGIHTTR